MPLEKKIEESVQFHIQQKLNSGSDSVIEEGISYYMEMEVPAMPVMEAEKTRYESRKKEQVMYLANDESGEYYIITKTDSGVQGVHISGGQAAKATIGNESSLKGFLADKSTEGFRVVRSKSEAKKIMRKNMRPISRYMTSPVAISAGIGATLVAISAAFLPDSVSDSVEKLIRGFGIGDSVIDDAVTNNGFFPLDVTPVPQVDMSGVEALIAEIGERVESEFERQQASLEDLASRLDAEGASEQAAQVRRGIENIRDAAAREIESSANAFQTSMGDIARDAAVSQSVRAANDAIIDQLSRLFSLQGDLEERGLDDAARDVGQSIRQLQSQLR